MKNEICQKLKIKYPIIQAGMVWVSGGKLAAAAANAGCLGTIGAGSMKPDLLSEHIKKAKSLLLENCPGNLAVNIPLLYQGAEEQIKTALDLGIKVFITSAGSPKKFTQFLKDKECIVIHVISTPALAKKCQDAGVDMVIAEGFEAGGHNGRDELTTLSLIPQVLKSVHIPVIAAGGIASGEAILAMLSLGARAVQMGTRFLMTQESSAHDKFKQEIIKADSTSTMLMMKKHVPVRLLKNKFYHDVQELEEKCATQEALVELLGKGRARDGMLHGDLDRGELEVGQVVGLINDLSTVSELVDRLIEEYNQALSDLVQL